MLTILRLALVSAPALISYHYCNNKYNDITKESSDTKFIRKYKFDADEYFRSYELGDVLRKSPYNSVVLKDLYTYNMYNVIIDNSTINSIEESRYIVNYIPYNLLFNDTGIPYMNLNLSKFRFTSSNSYIKEVIINDVIYLYGEYKDNLFIVNEFSNSEEELIKRVCYTNIPLYLSIFAIISSIFILY